MLLAILTGLGNVGVTRLTSIWSNVSSKMIHKYEQLEQFMSPENGFFFLFFFFCFFFCLFFFFFFFFFLVCFLFVCLFVCLFVFYLFYLLLFFFFPFIHLLISQSPHHFPFSLSLSLSQDIKTTEKKCEEENPIYHVYHTLL